MLRLEDDFFMHNSLDEAKVSSLFSSVSLICIMKSSWSLEQVDSSVDHLDLDLDLESGGTSDEDASKISQNVISNNSKNLLGRTRSGFFSSESISEFTKVGDYSYPYDRCIISDEISAKNNEKLREEMMNFVVKTVHKEKPKKHISEKPSKPPRPPRGPSLDASDMKLLKEIYELNLNRKRMERTRTLKKIKKEKTSPLISNLLAGLVTVIFLLVIIFHGLLGSQI